MSFTKNISKYVLSEFDQAKRLTDKGQAKLAFTHLENAHVLGQSSTKWHTIAHFKMLLWAVKYKDPKEAIGQMLRIIGALTKTVFGLVPEGSTGGANVSPFKPMDISAAHQSILESALSK